MIIFEKKIAGLSDSSLGRFVLRARRAAGLRGPVNILVTSSTRMQALNRLFRNKNKATDVLSFPADATRKPVRFAGEIAISADIAIDNARRLGHTAALEIKTLALHGILHLAGMDHERDNGQMARKEARLRRTLHLPSALTERSHASAASSTRSRRTVSRHTQRSAKNP